MRKFSKHTPEQIVVKLEKAEALRGDDQVGALLLAHGGSSELSVGDRVLSGGCG